MWSWIFMLLIHAGHVLGQSIIIPPVSTIRKIGETAQFDCGVVFESLHTITWEHNGNIIYSLLGGIDDYPKGNDKYTVSGIGKTFTLAIRDLSYVDGGEYTCLVTTISETATLIVLGTPSLIYLPLNPSEGDMVEYTCEALFGGPNDSKIPQNLFPKLSMIFDGRHVGMAKTRIKGQNQPYELVTSYNISTNASTKGKQLICEIETSNPTMGASSVNYVNVTYSARNTNYTPQKRNYEIGDILTCTADGNPNPSFEWVDVLNPGRSISGNLLNATTIMVGQNSWNCTATNYVNGVQHQDTVTAVFTVGKVLLVGATSSDGTSVILPVTIVLILLVIVVAVIVVFCWRMKKAPKRQYGRVSCNQSHRVPCKESLCMQIIKHLKTEEDLEFHEKQIKDLLYKDGVTILQSEPQIFTTMVETAIDFMNSPLYADIIKRMAEIYGKLQNKPSEGPLLSLLQLLMKQEDHVLPEIWNRIHPIIEVLTSADSIDSRSNFLMNIITKYNPESKEHLKWTDLFTTIAYLINDRQANPNWLSDYGPTNGNSPQYAFFSIIYKVLLLNGDLHESVQKCIRLFLPDARIDYTGHRGSPLHALVEIEWAWFNDHLPDEPTAFFQGFEHLIKVIKEYHDFTNQPDRQKRTPLHKLIDGIKLPEHFLPAFLGIIHLLRTEYNINSLDDKQQTVLHYLAEAWPVFYKQSWESTKYTDLAKDWSPNHNTKIHLGKFFDMFISIQNKLTRNIERCTALHILCEKVFKEPCVGEGLKELFDDLITYDNVNAQDSKLMTPYGWILHGKSKCEKQESKLVAVFSEIALIFQKRGASSNLAGNGITLYVKNNPDDDSAIVYEQ